jgi:hypothetical protein
MFKKLGTAALTAAIALLGFQALPAQADPLDATPESFLSQSTNYSFDLSSQEAATIAIPSGVYSANLSRAWNLRQVELAAHAGETVSIVGTVTAPDGTVSNIVPSDAGRSRWSVSLNISKTNGPGVSNMWNEGTITIPASDVSSGTASISYYMTNYDNNNVKQPLAAGNYIFNPQLKIGNTIVTTGASFTDPWSLTSNRYNYDVQGATVTAPADATSAYLSAEVCVDSTKIAVGDVLTGKVFVDGTEKTGPMTDYSWRGYVNMGPSRMPGATVVQGDITNGLKVRFGKSISVTAGQTYALAYRIVNQSGASVTGTCAAGKPAKPTLTFTNGSFSASGSLPSFADNMSNDCQLFDAAAPTVVVATVTNTYADMGTINCGFSGVGLVSGHSYFVKIRGGYNMAAKGEWSDPSDSVVKTAAGVSFTNPISGIANQGGKLSIISATTPADETGSPIVTTNDGANGAFVVSSESVADEFGGTIVGNFKVRHITAAGVDSSFAGTGALNVAPAAQSYDTNGRFAWYGNRDKFVFTNAVYPMMGNGGASVKIVTGTMNSATVTTTNLTASVASAACVSAFGSGHSANQPGGMMSPPSVGLTPIAAPTAVPVYLLSCMKSYTISGMPTTIPVYALVTVADANTVTVVKAFQTPGANVNTGSVSISVNPSAGANDAAITVFARSSLQTGPTTSMSTTDSRVIYTIKKDLTVATSTGTWTSVATEPALRLSQLNDGTIWGLLQEGASFRLLKVVGDNVTMTPITIDSNAAFTTNALTMPLGIQPGNSSSVVVVRQNSTSAPVAMGMANIDTATGNLTTSEVARYTYADGPGAFSANLVDGKNLYWLFNDAATSTKVTIARWRDPAYVAVVAVNQTITWTTSPATMTAGGTTTVAATASSGLAVTYSSTDATKCTVNASTGVVTAVATTGTCTITANQAGNDSFNAAPARTLAITIAAVTPPTPAKKTPRVPTVTTKLKIGKTISVVLHATKGTASKGANIDGLATVVSASSASKAYCSVAKVIKNKKITGYTVKGLKAGKCSVVVTITGSSTYNSLTKTVVVTVTK